MIKINFTEEEKRRIILWAEHAVSGGHYGNSNFMIPEEEITLEKLKSGNKKLELSTRDIKMIKYWAESTLGSSLSAMLAEEISIIEKLKKAENS